MISASFTAYLSAEGLSKQKGRSVRTAFFIDPVIWELKQSRECWIAFLATVSSIIVETPMQRIFCLAPARLVVSIVGEIKRGFFNQPVSNLEQNPQKPVLDNQEVTQTWLPGSSQLGCSQF